MTPDEAKQAILRHAGQPTVPGAYGGLLARLRPFVGLDDADFLELLEALLTLAPSLRSTEALDRETIRALWDICRTARFWSGPPGVTPKTRPFIPLTTRRRLDSWVDELERMTLELLHGEDVWVAFLGTAWLAVHQKYGPRAAFRVPIWQEALTKLLADEGELSEATAPQAEDMRVLCEALARVGPAGAASQELLTTIAGQSHFAQVRRAA
ncbi:MAG: hypothetical protein ACRCZF_21550, partial [Gemmataceae bacterium]